MSCLQESQGRKDVLWRARFLHTHPQPRSLAKKLPRAVALPEGAVLVTVATLPHPCMPGPGVKVDWRKHLQMPLYPSGKKWANPAEQTPAHGFAFVFISQNEAVPVADSG